MADLVEVLMGDCRDVLRTLPDQSVQCVVTSPPYWNLRDYGVDGQIGLEKNQNEFLQVMVDQVFGEVYRVLRDDGTAWVNLGDNFMDGCLQGMPWEFALMMIHHGEWILRSDIIWHKPNPTPEPDRKRPTMAHEYMFLFTKHKSNYFYDTDAIRETRGTEADPESYEQSLGNNEGADADRLGTGYQKNSPTLTHPNGANKRTVWTVATKGYKGAHFATFPPDLIRPCILAGTSEHGACADCGAPYQRVTEPTDEYKKRLGASWHDHKDDLGRGQRGTPPDFKGQKYKTTGWEKTCKCDTDKRVPCTVLDPFGGSGTTGEVAMQHGRQAILIELNPEYEPLIRERTSQQRLNLTGGF